MNSPFWREILRQQHGWSSLVTSDQTNWQGLVMERANGFGPHFVDPRTKGPTLREILNNNAPAPKITREYGIGIVDPRTATITSGAKSVNGENTKTISKTSVETVKTTKGVNIKPMQSKLDTTTDSLDVAINGNAGGVDVSISVVGKANRGSSSTHVEQKSSSSKLNINGDTRFDVNEKLQISRDNNAESTSKDAVKPFPVEDHHRYKAVIVDPRTESQQEKPQAVNVPLIPLSGVMDTARISKDKKPTDKKIKSPTDDPVSMSGDILPNLKLDDSSAKNADIQSQILEPTSNINNRVPIERPTTGSLDVNQKPYFGKKFEARIIDPRTVQRT